MAVLRDGRFWGGVITGVLLLAFFPALNPRTMLARKPSG